MKLSVYEISYPTESIVSAWSKENAYDIAHTEVDWCFFSTLAISFEKDCRMLEGDETFLVYEDDGTPQEWTPEKWLETHEEACHIYTEPDSYPEAP